MAIEYCKFYQRDDDGNEIASSIKQFNNGQTTRGVYEPVLFERSEITQGGYVGGNETVISFSIKNEFAKARFVNRNERRYWVDIHATSTSTLPYWTGKLRTVNSTDITVLLIFSALLGSLRVYGLPIQYQQRCRHSLYDTGCGVDEMGNSRDVTIDSIYPASNAASFTDDTSPPSWNLTEVNYGILKQGDRSYHVIEIATVGRTNPILALDNVIKLERGAATLLRGCDKTTETCAGRYSNIINFGGFPYLPNIDVWGTDLVKYSGKSREFSR